MVRVSEKPAYTEKAGYKPIPRRRALMKLLAPLCEKPRKMTDSRFISWLEVSVIRGIA